MTVVRATGAILLAWMVCLAWSAGAVAMPRGDTLETIRKRGQVVCGVRLDLTGFATRDAEGRWSGIEADFCGALAAAVFGRKNAVEFRVLSPGQQFAALKAGDVDVLAAHSVWTMTLDSAMGLRFAATLLYDGLAIMVRRRQGVSSTLELSGVNVCALAGHGGQQTVRDYFVERRMRVRSFVTSKDWDTLVQGYASGQCDALAGDATELARSRGRLKDVGEHVVLPERLVLEPVGALVRAGDERWFSVVRWTMMALIAAEEAGVTRSSVDTIDARSETTLAVRRLLGLEGDLGVGTELPRDWTRHVIGTVGNYGEIYERNLGAKSTMKITRGLNNLWSKGGLMMAPPFR